MKHSIKYAGLSVENGGDIRFRTTGTSGKHPIWVTLPGHIQCVFVKLPRAMNKLDATKHLLRHKAFRKARFKKFLQNQLNRREAGLPVNPREQIRRGRQANGRVISYKMVA